MILIFSDNKDQSTNDVIDWLNYRGYSFKRINPKDIYFDINSQFVLELNNDGFRFKDDRLTNEIDAIWLRRWYDLTSEIIVCDKFYESEMAILKHINEEFQSISYALFKSLFNKKWFTYPEKLTVNKISVLQNALNVGLDIPDTLISNNKSDVNKFLKTHKKIICKSSGENISFLSSITRNVYMQYVKEVSSSYINDLPNIFFPSFFQKKIEKEFDIRTFYLDGKCFSMAIFSKKTDFREDYDDHRYIPLKLPENIETKINQLMSVLKLNTGSIDLIKCKITGKYYFIEINPNGHFSMVSIPCNYYLEKEVAKFLCYEYKSK